MSNGKVIIGFSHPYVGLYTNSGGGDNKYIKGMRLARGVSVSLDVEASDDNEFYADNVVAESEGGKFSSGTLKYTVDGMLDAAERFIYGLPEPEAVTYKTDKTVNVTKYGDDAAPPYVGAGHIIMYQSGGVVTYQPMILTKVKFSTHGLDAKTKEEQKDWQTQDLEATICRDDSENHTWKWLAEEQTTEAAAVEILEALLGVGVEE